MKFLAVLNRDGGTLKTTDLDAFQTRTRGTLEQAGHTIDFVVTSGKELVDQLAAASRKRSVDVVMAGGGDGTISAAATAMMGSRKALAVLPAGTMNLFARSLGVPLDLDQAVKAFADAPIREVDLATANGEPFIHQFSIGMHATLVAKRSRMTYKSRLGKIRASTRAALDTILNPPNVRVMLTLDGKTEEVRSTGIGISNNLFGEGHLPYADKPDGGVLGVYVTRARKRMEVMLFSLNMALGRWEANEHVDVSSASEAVLKVRKTRRRQRCVIDGELRDLAPVTTIAIAPKSLRVLAPAPAKAP